MTKNELFSEDFRQISLYFPEINDYYWINSIGKIYSTNTDKFLAPYIDKDGYYRQALTLKRVNENTPKIKLVGIHMMVNTIFNKFPPSDMEHPVTDHIDGNKTNNDYRNLRWLSNRDNASHYYRHLGKKSIIDDHDIPIIVREYLNGVSINELAERYKTNYKYMYGILSGDKRRVAYEMFNIKPPIKPEKMIDVFDVWEIAFKLLSDPSPTRISKELDIPVTKIAHIKGKAAWAPYTEDFDFINQTTTIFDDSEDIFVTNDLTKIGETEYFVPSDWNDNEVGISDIL